MHRGFEFLCAALPPLCLRWLALARVKFKNELKPTARGGGASKNGNGDARANVFHVGTPPAGLK
jgi:hypothetical protein